MNYLAIDVGGTYIKYALVNEKYEILSKGKEKTPMTNFDDFRSVIEKIYASFENIQGIGMSLPGMMNRADETMLIPGALLYNQGVNVLRELKQVTTPQFTIENDAKCAALCELKLGSLQDTEIGAVCIIGTGIGGAITMGNQVLKGTHNFSGEFSYLNTAWSEDTAGFKTLWGNTGGVNYLIRKVMHTCSIDEEIDGKKVFELCNQGNEEALQALREYCDGIAVGLYNIQAVVDPERIAIGGGISKQPILLETLQKSLDVIYQKMPMPIPQVKIVSCKYYNDSNLLGALVKYHQEFE